jgi:hypothetical protein
MMKKLLTILIPICLFIGCEDEVEEATACTNILANMEANMDAANEKFENDPTKENCDAIAKLAQEIYDCMPAGPDKDELKEGLDQIKASCSSLFG